MRPYQTHRVLADICGFHKCPLYRNGVELSLEDSQTVREVYQQWLALMIDIGYLHPDTLKRNAQRLWLDLVRADVIELNNAFAELLHLVRMQRTKGFKALCSRISPHLYNIIKCDKQLMSEGNVFAAARLTQAFAYTSRLSLRDIDITQQLLDDYRRIEEEIPEDFNDNLTKALNDIIKGWFLPYQPDNLYPQHGPGGVANQGRCSLERKYNEMRTDERLAYSFGNDPWWIVSQPVRPPKGKMYKLSQVALEKHIRPLVRISQTIFVPKSYKTFRTISMEPATLQFFQQGVQKEIQRYVRNHDYLNSHIGFDDQVRNWELARLGSIERNFATIDLSAASDSVSYTLVKRLFKGTWLLRHLVTLRSPWTSLPDKTLLKLKKFAPMGSSLCFPIETIVFASICELVTRSHHVAGKYSVYGDDIIIPTQCVEGVMNILTLLGFRVNREKSFYQSDCWFRESCGGEFFDGYDATPMKVSRKYAYVEEDVRIGKLIELANSAYTRGYRNLRYFFINKLREDEVVPHYSPTALLGDNYSNYHTRRRWNTPLQRYEARCHTAVAEYGEGSALLLFQNDSIRYHHWLVSTAGRREAPGSYRLDLSSARREAYGMRVVQDGKILFTEGFESVIARPMMILKPSWCRADEGLDPSLGSQELGMPNSRQ